MNLKVISLLLTLLSLASSALGLNAIPVRLLMGDSKLTDMGQNSYDVCFSEHKKMMFLPLKPKSWIYGILLKDNHNGKWRYQLEIPQIGRMVYKNPDTSEPVVLDQVEWHHPSFIWLLIDSGDSDEFTGKALLENLSGKDFVYKTLIGDVTSTFQLKIMGEDKDIEYVKALRINAPRQKVVRQVLRYKPFL